MPSVLPTNRCTPLGRAVPFLVSLTFLGVSTALWKGQVDHQIYLTLSAVLMGLLGTSSLLFSIFTYHVWRTPLGRILGCSVPDIQGTWRGLLTHTHLPPGVVNPGPLIVFLVVRQSPFGLKAAVLSMESRSRVLAAAFTEEQGAVHLVYTYRKVSLFRDRRQAPPCLGTAVLTLDGTAPTSLQGTYSNQHLIQGELKFNMHAPELARSYREALGLRYTVRTARGRRTKKRPVSLQPLSPTRSQV
ncbi:hypothetical protein [Deinococcus hopiensis]|uniref:Uncharacterized protein n=1 Tax=Deinococcus hopiensis KR-140 TaxID=695939 RepID=A0A1W1UDY1_9DEIO|nr:hypothetical protein [Deinococcus hopiensis]SMB79287.1 hypothetical protein SAMN00790413_05869 [Deinococcus hopiensis KR-140]